MIAGGIALGMFLAFTRHRPQGEIGDIAARDAAMRSSPFDHRRGRHGRAYVPRPSLGRGDAGTRLAGEAVTDARGARYTAAFPHAVEIEQIISATLPAAACWQSCWCRFALRGVMCGVQDAARQAAMLWWALAAIPTHSRDGGGMVLRSRA